MFSTPAACPFQGAPVHEQQARTSCTSNKAYSATKTGCLHSKRCGAVEKHHFGL
jgi:hypothetical protein